MDLREAKEIRERHKKIGLWNPAGVTVHAAFDYLLAEVERNERWYGRIVEHRAVWKG